MKQQISRLSPHQNGKVVAVLAAVASLIVVVPVVLLTSLAGAGAQGVPLWAIFILPVIYLIVGYIANRHRLRPVQRHRADDRRHRVRLEPRRHLAFAPGAAPSKRRGPRCS